MSLISTLISNLFNGVSQQPAELRDPSQATMQLNAVSSPAYGLRKRPGTSHVARIGDEATDPVVHFINRDADEQYAVVATNGGIRVFDVQTGGEVQVSAPSGMDYLKCGNPQEDLRLVSVADYTFVVNTKRPVQLSAGLVDAQDQLAGTVSFPIPLLQTPVVVPPNSTLTPSPSGTGSSVNLPTYGGGSPGAGGTHTVGDWDPNLSTDKPSDPSNPFETNPIDNSPGTGDTGTGSGGTGTGTGDTGTGSGGTGTGTGGTGTGGGTTPPTDPTPPDPAPTPVTAVSPNADGTWPADLKATSNSFMLPTEQTAMPGVVGDYMSVINALNAAGFWQTQDQLFVTYRPRVCVKVKSGGEGIGRFFTADTLFPDPGMVYQIVTAGLQSEGKFTLVPVYSDASMYFNNGYSEFPRLVWASTADPLAAMQATPGAAILTRTYDQEFVVRDALAFDATYLFLLQSIEDGTTQIQELPVRISAMGFVGSEDSVGASGGLRMTVGNPNLNYTHGGLLYDAATMEYDAPFMGFTNEHNLMVVFNTNPPQSGTRADTGLHIAQRLGIPYAKDVTYPAHGLIFNPPMAYKLVPKALATKANLGDFVAAYAPYGGTVGLIKQVTIN